MGMRQTISIVICTKDREPTLKNTLNTVFYQTHQPYEIIIVDDGNLNQDEIINLVEQNGIPCQFLKKDTPGLTVSRNWGANHAQGDIILFLDDDVILDKEYIAGIMEIFEADSEKKVGGVTGTLKFSYRRGVLPFLYFFGLDTTRPGALLPSCSGGLVREPWITQPMEIEWLAGCNMSYRREVFENFRFDNSLAAHGWIDDRDFSIKVSHQYKLMATPKAKLIHLKDPAGRLDTRRFGFMETNYMYRCFAEHMPKNLVNWLALGWAMIGIMLKNLLLAITTSKHRAMLAQFRGNLEGVYAIKTGKDFSSQ